MKVTKSLNMRSQKRINKAIQLATRPAKQAEIANTGQIKVQILRGQKMNTYQQIESKLHNNYKHSDIEECLSILPLKVVLKLNAEELAFIVGNVQKLKDNLYRKYN